MPNNTNLTDTQQKLYETLKPLIQYEIRSTDLEAMLEEASDDDLEKVLTVTKLLSYAISSGDPEHLEKVKTTLEGSDILNEVNSVLNSIITEKLHSAAKDGDLNAVQTVLQKGADVNSTNQDDFTALHFAAQNGHLRVIEVLLEKEADVHAKDENGLTLLWIGLLKMVT